MTIKKDESVKQWTMFDKEVFERFVKPGEVIEIRILKAFGNSSAAWEGYAKGTVSGYFDSHEQFCNAVNKANKASSSGIYFTLQVIKPSLIGRAFNRLKAADITTSDNDVVFYRWLPIDIDPIRPSGVSSSEAELSEAITIRDMVADYAITELGLPEPIRAVSGNGGHLLFQLPDLSVKEASSKAFIVNTLSGLAAKFNTDTVTIDTSVFNPARIWKLYGTKACKGDEVPAGEYRIARPHRIAYIDSFQKVRST